MADKFKPQTKRKIFLELFSKTELIDLGRTEFLTTGCNQRRMAIFSKMMLVKEQHPHRRKVDRRIPFNPVNLLFPPNRLYPEPSLEGRLQSIKL